MTWGSPGASCWALYAEREHQVSHQGSSNQCPTQHATCALSTPGDPAWKGAQPAGDGLGRKPPVGAAVDLAGALRWSYTEPGACPLHCRTEGNTFLRVEALGTASLGKKPQK